MRASTGRGRAVVSTLSALAVLALAAGAAMESPIRVSGSPAGVPGNNHSYEAAVTPSGRYVAFDSKASNILPEATGTFYQVFLVDRKTGDVELVSANEDGIAGNGNSFNPCLSSNGRYVLFQSFATNLVPGDGNGQSDVF